MIQDRDDHRPFALVVDDDITLLMHAADILSEAGFASLETMDVDATELILIEHADEIMLLVTDVQMSGVRDGFALARMTAERWPEIGILVASGLVYPVPGSMPEGAMFMTKPIHAQNIFGRLQALLPDGRKPEPLKAQARHY